MKMVLLLGSFQKTLYHHVIHSTCVFCKAYGSKKQQLILQRFPLTLIFFKISNFLILEVFMSSTHCVLTHGELQYLSWSCKAMNC